MSFTGKLGSRRADPVGSDTRIGGIVLSFLDAAFLWNGAGRRLTANEQGIDVFINELDEIKKDTLSVFENTERFERTDNHIQTIELLYA